MYKANKSLCKDLWFLSQTTLGIYHDNCKGLSVNTIQECYGVNSEVGNPLNGKDASGDENPMPSGHHTSATISANQQADQAYHETVYIPPLGNPFVSDEKEVQFYDMLQQVVAHSIMPENFGLTGSKWKDGNYSIYEMIHMYWPSCL